MALKLKWDGTDIGDISEYFISIEEPEIDKVGSKLTLKVDKQKIICLAWKYKNIVPLLVDELKPIFGLPKIGRHKCIIQDTPLLIAKYIDSEENIFEPKLYQFNQEQIEETIIFRYIIGLISNGNCLWYRQEEGVISYKDITIAIEKKSSKISETNIKKWFDSEREKVKPALVRLLNKSSVLKLVSPKAENKLIKIQQLLRLELEKIIKKIDKNYLFLCVSIMSRIQNVLADTDD